MDVYDGVLPRFTLIPDDRAFKRMVPDSKVLLEDCFNKKVRNVDYLDNEDEFFTDNNIYFEEDDLVGFSDYSVVGEEFNESGFAPVAVAIHIIYFDENKALRIHHLSLIQIPESRIRQVNSVKLLRSWWSGAIGIMFKVRWE